MKLNYSITMITMLAAIPLTLADPDPKTRRRKTKNRTTTESCPNNQVSYKQGNDHYCCPGKVLGVGNNPYCCVGAADVNASATTSVSCSTTIPLSEKSYSSLAQAAATSLSGSSTSKAEAAAMMTSGPLAGALMAVGGLALAL